MVNLEVSYCGLILKNPILVASGGITATLDHLKRAQENGAGAVVMKSYFEEKKYREDPTPSFKILRRKAGRLKADTLYSYEQASSFDKYSYAEEIKKAKENLSIPIIASIDCFNYEESIEVANLFYEAGADALVVKGCPHGELAMSGKSYEAVMLELLKGMKEKIKIPIIVKLLPQLSNPLKTSIKLERGGADGLVLFNRFSGLDVDVDSESPILHKGYAGHGGLWSIYYSLRWISEVYPKAKLSLCGSGGVFSGKDIVKYLLSGACCVAICTSIILNGYEVIEKMKKELENWMIDKGYNSINEFIGKAAEKIKGIDEIKRGREVVANIDQDLCTSCGKCMRSCFHQAIKKANTYYVDREKCVGCGLCEQVCPSSAIKMKKI